ncbi:MAG: ATP-grasp domain-containing protein [Candidatus Omnitrophota bacterium]
MSNVKKVLVIGTTADYIELLIDRFEDRVFFVTDFEERIKWKGVKPASSSELLLDLEDHGVIVNALEGHLREHNIVPSGVACFDCESLALAAIIAVNFELPFPGLESVMNCRSKNLSKSIWKGHGIPCPDFALIRDEGDAMRFFDSLNGPAVMKPLSGSGSELVLSCKEKDDCRQAYKTIIGKLQSHPNHRMYTALNMPADENPREVIMMEQYIPGEEYSCDFILEDGCIRILRLAKKIINQGATFGTVSAYVLKADLPGKWDIEKLEARLQAASKSLGLNRAIAMVDFKIYDDEVFLLEITPRPGGDCLPPLIQVSSGFDILKAALDFAEGKQVFVPDREQWKKVVGFPLIASQRGVLKTLDADALASDSRVVSCYFKRSMGDTIELPPEDYDSRLLGYVIFRPNFEETMEKQCLEIAQKLIIEVK